MLPTPFLVIWLFVNIKPKPIRLTNNRAILIHGRFQGEILIRDKEQTALTLRGIPLEQERFR